MSQPAHTASAPGKAILLGEHAAVYARPAIAIPLPQIRAQATVTQGQAGAGVWLAAPDLGQFYPLADAGEDDPLAACVRHTLTHLGRPVAPDLVVTVRSAIPTARGMGSGAAVATAIVRALAAAFDQHLPVDEVSALVYRTETLLHGTPSGIDNTVVAYEQPVYFVRGQAPVPLVVGGPLRFLVADTGVPSLTRDTVGDVRRGRQADPAGYEALFDQIGGLVVAARDAIAAGDADRLGHLMDRNQTILDRLGVSSPDLDRLAGAARAAGARGAKLSGGGRGGILLALVTPAAEAAVLHALRDAGAVQVLAATLMP